MAEIDRSLIGQWGPEGRMRVEAGKIAEFAKAVKDDNPAFTRSETPPAPPTFLMTLAHWMGSLGETRQGIKLDRATLGNWAGRACFHLQPIAAHMRRHLAGAERLFMDECSTRGAGRPRRASSGRSLPTTAATAAPVRRSCCSATPRGAAARRGAAEHGITGRRAPPRGPGAPAPAGCDGEACRGSTAGR